MRVAHRHRRLLPVAASLKVGIALFQGRIGIVAVVLAGAVIFAISGCSPQSEIADTPTPVSAILPNVDDAVQRALRVGKPTVAEFGSTVCVGCREMKLVLAALRRDFSEQLTVVDVDLLAQKAEGYQQRYRILVMPTQVFYDTEGRETGRHMGTITTEEILRRLGVVNAMGKAAK